MGFNFNKNYGLEKGKVATTETHYFKGVVYAYAIIHPPHINNNNMCIQ